MRTQQSECIDQNFKVSMPDGSKEPICKEGVSDSIIPGCGPLPTSDGLSWRTKSGRPLQVKSTVYEVYYPRCSQNGVLNRDIHSVRCGEDLRWNAGIQGLRCLYGFGLFPIFSKWRLQNESEAGNESLVGETYFRACSPGHKRSMVMYCGQISKWHTNYSTPCETDKYGFGLFPIGSKLRLQNGSEAGNESLMGETYFSECSPCHKRSMVMYCGHDSKWHTYYSAPCETDDCGCSLGAFLGILILVGCVYMRYCFDAHSPSPEFPVTTENEEYPMMTGETVFIATKEKLNDCDCLQIFWRQDLRPYRNLEMHPFCTAYTQRGVRGIRNVLLENRLIVKGTLYILPESGRPLATGWLGVVFFESFGECKL